MADLPIHEKLAAELAHVPCDQFLLVMQGDGLAEKPTTLSNWFEDQCKAAGNPLCSTHGMRKSLATLMVTGGKPPDEFRAVMAHKNDKQGATYTKKADRSRLADSAFVGMFSTEAERNLSNLSMGLDTSASQLIERKSLK